MAKRRRQLHDEQGNVIAEWCPHGGKVSIWYKGIKHLVYDWELVGFPNYISMKQASDEIGARTIVNSILFMREEKLVPLYKTKEGKKFLDNAGHLDLNYDDDGDFTLGVTPSLVKKYVRENLAI